MQPETSQRPTTDDQRRALLLSAFLFVLPLLLYAPVRHHGFLKLWDDDAYVTDNPHVRTGLTLANVRWAFTSFEQSNWHPVTWLSHMLDCQLFGLNPGPQHFVNVLLHAANVLLLFWILQKATRATWRSFFVAMIFAVHPLNVETVAWIAQRKSLLSAFFSLLTIAAYGWYVRRGGWQRYLLVAIAFALALMSKPMAVTLPLALLLFDYWPLKRREGFSTGSSNALWPGGRLSLGAKAPGSLASNGAAEAVPFPNPVLESKSSLLRRWSMLLLEKLPLLAMGAASSVLTEMAQGAGGSVMGLSLLPVSARIENAAISYVAYIGKMFWPARLAAYYPLRLSPPLGDAIASAAILIVITALVVRFRRRRSLEVGWFFFLITMIPVIGIVQVGFQGMADRYTYVPAIGLMIAVVWGFADAVANRIMARRALTLAGLCICIALGGATHRYLACWQNSVTLFAQARTTWGQPDMWLEQLYGNALFSAGRVDEALSHYQESCAIEPRTEYCHYNIAHIYSGRGQFRDALREYDLALRYTANREMALLCLTEAGAAQMQLGDYAAAERSAARALAIDPANPVALQLREQILHAKGAN